MARGPERRAAARDPHHAGALRLRIVSRPFLGERENLSLPDLEWRRVAALGKWPCLAYPRAARPRRDPDRVAVVRWTPRLRRVRRQSRRADLRYHPHARPGARPQFRPAVVDRVRRRWFPLQDGAAAGRCARPSWFGNGLA